MARDYVKNRNSRSSSSQTKASNPTGVVWLFMGVLIGLIIAGGFYLKNQHGSITQAASTPVTKSLPVPKPKQTTPASTQNLQTQFDFYNVLPSQKVVGPSGDEDTSDINNQNNSLNNPQPATTSPATQQTQTTPNTEAPQTINQQTTTNQETSPTTPEPSNNTTPSTTPVSTQTTPAPSPQPSINSQNTSTSTVHTPSTTAPATKPVQTIKSTAATTSNSNNSSSNNNSKSQNFVLQIATFSQFTDADQLKAQLSLSGFEVNITQINKNGKTMERVWLGPFHSESEAKSVQTQLQSNQINSELLKSS